MPGPFPGMDPYLEHPAGWQDVHQRFISNASAALNALLPPRYVARIDERLYVIPPERNIYPDMLVLKRPGRSQEPAGGGGGVAVVVATEPTGIIQVLPEERHEGLIQIVRAAGEGAAVTVVELLSPSNKATGSDGRTLYLAKQGEILQSQTNLIEIDLLRSGEHTVAPDRERLLFYGPWDYLVVSRRGGPIGHWEFWSIAVRDRLPRIRVPLAEEDPDVVLDLQAVLDRCYDEGAYARSLDYRAEPVPPLTVEDQAWADGLLREKGLRGEPAGPA